VTRLVRNALPGVALAVLLATIFILQPRAMSYFGLNLLLNLAIPITFATLGQMLIITVNDLDLSAGSFVSLVACITATLVPERPLLGCLALAGGLAGYAAVGALVTVRRLPAIVVTLGLAFVWQGLAVLLMPTPGGRAPEWLIGALTVKPPLLPLPVHVAAVLALVGYWGLMRSSVGAVWRGAGGNPRALERAGWSLLRVRVTVYALAGLCHVLAGLSLVGLTTSADANIASRYTLLSIAGVILGGGEFVGGQVSPPGAVLGAMVLTLAASFLAFMRISPDWQIGAQGGVLIAVLALRVGIDRLGAR
jgi:ribose transport system permease protein